MFTFFMVAITLTTVANVLVTMALAPLLTAVAARVFIGHKHRAAHGGCDRGGGVRHRLDVRQPAQPGGINFTGTLVALCVAISGAANWTVTQHAMPRGMMWT
jgi:hypothetical protein